MQKITIIIGLPGSGKTTYLAEHKSDFGDAFICDDYHKSDGRPTKDGFRKFENSVYFDRLREALSAGKDVVVADITYRPTP